jgi:hypothetical protein
MFPKASSASMMNGYGALPSHCVWPELSEEGSFFQNTALYPVFSACAVHVSLRRMCRTCISWPLKFTLIYMITLQAQEFGYVLGSVVKSQDMYSVNKAEDHGLNCVADMCPGWCKQALNDVPCLLYVDQVTKL